MKLCSIGLLVVVAIHGTFAKKYYNPQIAEDRTGLLGPSSHHIYESQDDVEEDGNDARENHVRRTEGEPELPSFANDHEEEEESSDQFYTAESLDFFKKGIDPDSFEWVNPDEIVPGESTCGFLKAPLGSLPDVTYPKVEVYVCMRFAENQPAPKGNIFTHCGGPGSLSECGIRFTTRFLDEDVVKDYNLISIDQRGVGRSWPSFVHEECSRYGYLKDGNGTIIGTVAPPEFETDGALTEENIKAMLPAYQRTMRDCWTCTRCDFHLDATQADGSVKNFHFLEYSGTRQLAEDIFRMRLLLNAPLMHLYGVSYGTQVFSTYATIFPSFTGLLALDSNLSSRKHEAMHWGHQQTPSRNIWIFSGGEGADTLRSLVQIILANVDRAEEICNAAANGDTDLIVEIVEELTSEVNVDEQMTKQGSDYVSQPTPDDYVFGNPDFTEINEGQEVSIAMVRGQDRSGAIYDNDRFAKEVVEFNESFSSNQHEHAPNVATFVLTHAQESLVVNSTT
ncbi:Secreted [Seminavis robusta]|uniref:Secreted n=1 Tax=Seminavis robusta TaxID=568900 RepID=A0A9N8DXB9_9STRA|nr:Secreted [Seminavis robusta]|eukprot:Sro437_g142790.1 Secreted (508) ;mRNA; f:15118-17180